ncbi:tetratricopeptide repeat protein [Siansivirga zeaxanthinifaciens]|uniref:Uncharacterized protein n=1 Tax=Siansivirga zeaxanthinifaciens CC-SAMT-1 TaxID=1454006 RepID=A0A0C5W9K4_9FLAO|nr:hypothetical protein [Siansivirga zeaxanthinifaciens]AJR03002.1 hypothetical protein AW14_04505 [Siansivirga zeaxanthinifaciens CC-SAMT-1]
MTPKQQERIKNKIKKVKAALAADKRFWGGQYHDGHGLRYIPPQLYIELNDYTGGLRYFNWFHKNFPDDSGYPDFLFEWTIILYKTGRLKEAEKKAFETFCSNTYLFDNFFERQVTKLEKWEGSNLETQEFVDNQFSYSNKQDNLADFSEWLDNFITAEKFILLSNKYLDIQKRLKVEKDTETRQYLIQHERQLVNEL